MYGPVFSSPFVRIAGAAIGFPFLVGACLILLAVPEESVGSRAFVAVMFAGMAVIGLSLMRMGVRLEDDTALIRRDFRTMRVDRAEVQAITGEVLAHYVIAERWVVFFELAERSIRVDGLTGDSLPGRRNRRVDRQVETLRAWVGGEDVAASG